MPIVKNKFYLGQKVYTTIDGFLRCGIIKGIEISDPIYLSDAPDIKYSIYQEGSSHRLTVREEWLSETESEATRKTLEAEIKMTSNDIKRMKQHLEKLEEALKSLNK